MTITSRRHPCGIMSLFCLSSLAFGAASFASASAVAAAPQISEVIDGSWLGPWTWITIPPNCEKEEFAHAALIPVGSLQGKVLMWKNHDCTSSDVQTRVFEPENPGTLVEVQTDLESNIFCSGLSWNWQGHLVVAGGIRDMAPTPAETYRFAPHVMTNVKVFPIGGGPPHYLASNIPWQLVGYMSFPRYYATLVPLNRQAIQSAGVLEGTGGQGAPLINGGGHLVLGGPPLPMLMQNPCVFNDGNDVWQIFDPGTDDWSHTLVSIATQYNVQALTREIYDEHPSLETARLDSYPRAFQLADPVPSAPTIKGQVFVVNDVDSDYDPGLPPPNTPGDTWVIKPPSATTTGRWEMWPGVPEPVDLGDCTGGPPVMNCHKDRFYGTAILMHTEQEKNRVLVFGGSQDPNYDPDAIDPIYDPNAMPTCSIPEICASDWRVNNSVWEHMPSNDPLNQDPVVNGSWNQKASLAERRIFLNAVVLPTGQILIVGGDRVDTAINHNLVVGPPCSTVIGLQGSPVLQPEIYDPGQSFLSAGSTRLLNVPLNQQIPRLYHSLAVLLPDGSVLIGGGDGDDSAYSGQIFRPPYLHMGTRPVITDAPMTVDFTTNPALGSELEFTVDVTVYHEQIAKVVLLRPAALTHHCDMDQRYIELEWSIDPASPTYESGATITLDVKSPFETIGPAGYYMIFVVEVMDDGDPLVLDDLIPSEGHFIRFKRR